MHHFLDKIKKPIIKSTSKLMTLYGATCPIWTDDLLIHTTTIFIAIINNVCSLDFLFIFK